MTSFQQLDRGYKIVFTYSCVFVFPFKAYPSVKKNGDVLTRQSSGIHGGPGGRRRTAAPRRAGGQYYLVQEEHCIKLLI